MAKRSLQGFPAGKWLTVAGHPRVKAVKVNRNGTVDAKVLDKPARNTKPKKKRKAKAKAKRPRKATNKKRTTKAVRRVPKKRKAKRTARKATNKKRNPKHPKHLHESFSAATKAAAQFAAKKRRQLGFVVTITKQPYDWRVDVYSGRAPWKGTAHRPTSNTRKPKKKRPLKMGSKAWVKKMARARARAARRRAA